MSDILKQILSPQTSDQPILYHYLDKGSGHVWETYSRQLRDEYLQCEGEGLDVAELREAFEAVSALDDGSFKALAADRLFKRITADRKSVV